MFDALPAPPAYEPYWRKVSFYAVFDGRRAGGVRVLQGAYAPPST